MTEMDHATLAHTERLRAMTDDEWRHWLKVIEPSRHIPGASLLFAIEEEAGLTPAHIVSYAYPHGDQRRYSAIGWSLWQRYESKHPSNGGSL